MFEGPRLVLTGTQLNVVHDKTVAGYDTGSHSWTRWELAGNVLGSSWLPLTDGRLLRSGGLSEETGETSGECRVYTGGLGGQSVTLGSLSQPRQAHFLAQLKDHLFAAGGSRTGSAGEVAEVVEVEYYVPSTDTWHPLPVQPALSPGSSVLALLVVNSPLRTLQLHNKPRRGVKRSAGTLGVTNSDKKCRSV